MARTILVTVGISLVTEKVKDKERSLAGFGTLNAGPFVSLGALGEGLEREDQRLKSAAGFNPDLRKWQEARDVLVKKVGELWKKDLEDKYKRAWSGAELASLSLLGRDESGRDPLGGGDRVVLLASDTPSGAFCAATISQALREGVTGAAPGRVRVVDIAGLRADDADRFLNVGLLNTAKSLADYRPVAGSDDETLLMASGGYKGLLPYLTPIAMQLRIPLLYLYEESDKLLEIRPLAFPDDLKVVWEFRAAFNRIDPGEGREVEHAAAFWDDVDTINLRDGRDCVRKSGLVAERGEQVKLTSTGILACLLQPLVLANG